MNRNDQEQRLRTFMQGQNFAAIKPNILQGHATIIGSPLEPWAITTDEATAIIRKYHHELSAVVNNKRMVIYHQRPTD